MALTLPGSGRNVIGEALGLQGTTAAEEQAKRAAQQNQLKKQQCEAKGGTWDEANNRCIMPEPVKPTGPSPDNTAAIAPKPGTIEATGKIATLPDNRTFLNVNKTDIAKLAEGQAQNQLPDNVAPLGTAQAQLEQQLQLQAALQQLGTPGAITAAQQADINIGEALTAGAARVLPGLAGGAAAGAAAGLVGTGGALSIPAAGVVGAAGAVGGFVSGVLSNIKEQQQGEIGAATVELTNARTNMRQLAMLASRDPSNADMYVQLFNEQLTRVHQARAQIKAETTGNLNSYINDGRKELAEFDAFLREGGIADVYAQKFTAAINSGVPLSVNGEDLVFDTTTQ